MNPMLEPLPAYNPDKLDDAVLAMLSLSVLSHASDWDQEVSAEPELDFLALERLHAKGYLAARPCQPCNAVWVTPKGARRARELFRQMFCH